jgi:hypothetical protein
MTKEQGWSEENDITPNNTKGSSGDGGASKNNALVTSIMRYESGEMSDDEVVSFFQELINSGLCWQLQGHYGRTANSLIEQGVCDAKE